jgi:hypothetical protein
VRGCQWGRKRSRAELGKYSLRIVQPPYQEQASDLQVSRKRGIQPVSVLLEYHPGCVKGSLRPAQIARGKRDLGFSNDTPRA